MIVVCSKCGEEFLLKPDHRGFANVCAECFIPRKLTQSELDAAKAALNEKNRIVNRTISEENEKKRKVELAEDRRRIESAWTPESAQQHLMAYHCWIADRFPDGDDSFVFFFRWLKPSKRGKYYL